MSDYTTASNMIDDLRISLAELLEIIECDPLVVVNRGAFRAQRETARRLLGLPVIEADTGEEATP